MERRWRGTRTDGAGARERHHGARHFLAGAGCSTGKQEASRRVGTVGAVRGCDEREDAHPWGGGLVSGGRASRTGAAAASDGRGSLGDLATPHGRGTCGLPASPADIHVERAATGI